MAVSNQPEEQAALAAEQAPVTGPSEGVEGKAIPPGADGLEHVEGYQRPEYERLAAEIWTAPTADLRDIGEASFGPLPPVAETVHGVDDRVQITNTADYPWRVHASLLITAADNSRWIGTAWFIGPHTLVTAGHVVHIKNSGVAGRDGWVKSIQVMPGRDGTVMPYGSVTSTNFRSVTGWTGSGDENYDYGAITIPTELGSTTGWFGFGAWPDADLLKTTGNISGYPGDKPPGTQWYDARAISSVNALKVYYDIDTAGGQSGSAVCRIVDGNRYGIAVHAYGGATVNSGTRITRPVYDNLVAWRA
ncbi:endopeptidase [Streptomyces sp. NBC_00287]|uniref:trypsin-like serine peptidase n=1 Tax=Streptomyces sp. NBC_00287 TaxID=2975702 RepID=UPI002E28D010|nr:endopeptidase [Streptomyces sp. NBC_00287]